LIARIMPASPPATRHAAPSRGRSAITSVLLILLAVMIVRDILVRRWGSASPSPVNVTHRSP
jgi:hypothetical protein